MKFDLVIKNATVLTMNADDNVIADGVIGIKDGVITLVAERDDVASGQAAGINVTLGTDGAASNNMTDMIDTMRLAALIHKGACRDATAMSARKVVRMATTDGAKALGMDRIIGSIEAGKKADIVLFDPDKLKSTPMHDPTATIVYSSSSENIDTTIVNGKVVYRKGAFACGIEETQIAEQVRKELR